MKKYVLGIFSILMIINFSVAQNHQHLIIYGQSLSTGHQSWPSLSVDNVNGNSMIGEQVWSNFGNSITNTLFPLVANVAKTTGQLPKNRASNIYAECPLIAATNHIQLKTDGIYKFVATSCGTGGLTIEQLSKEYYNPVFYLNFTNALSHMSSATKDVECPALFLMQGEYNYAPTSSSSGLEQGSIPTTIKKEYKSLMIQLKNNMQSDVVNKYQQTYKPLFITYQAGVQYTRGKKLEIGMAQLEASNENDDIICAGPVYPMTDRGGHLDSNGYRWFGEILGKVYYRTKVLGQRFKPLQPLKISRTDNPRILKIQFLVPKLPLVFDELTTNKVANYGFEIYDNNVKRTIDNIVIQDDCVYISTTSDMIGNLEVVYAGPNNQGHGNLRDSDDEQAFYNYIDLDKKNMDGSYYYERDVAETTLRPSYEPKDVNGVIYDKPYPLYNFSVAFYYMLAKGTDTLICPNVGTYTGNNSLIKNDISVIFRDNCIFIRGLGDGSFGETITITDVNGSVLYNQNMSQSLVNGVCEIPLVLKRGIYIFKLSGENITMVAYKFLKV